MKGLRIAMALLLWLQPLAMGQPAVMGGSGDGGWRGGGGAGGWPGGGWGGPPGGGGGWPGGWKGDPAGDDEE